MKKIINILTITSLTTLCTFAQTTENREIKDFKNINSSSAIEVIIKQDSFFSVQIEAPSHKMEDVITEKNGNTLKVSMKGSWANKEEAKVIVTSPDYNTLTTSGASKMKSKGLISSDNLHLITSGASGLYLSIKTTDLKINSSGASNLILTGYTNNLNIAASGASEIKAHQLDASKAKISLSGASETEISVSDTIEGTVSGVAELDLKGEPKLQSINKSRSASIDDNSDKDGETFTLTLNNKEGIKVEEKNYGDTTKITIGKKKILIVDDWDQTKVDLDLKDTTDEPWYYGIDGMILGVNGFLNDKNQLNVPATHDYLELDIARSKSFQITALDGNIDLYKKYITFHPGLGLEFNSYEFRKNYFINESTDSGDGISAYKDTVNNYKKNRLKDTYLNAPVMFAFHTNKDHKKAFHLGVGGYAGVRLTSKMKYKEKGDGIRKEPNDYYLSPFRYGLSASIGYSNINIFANYALNGLFEDGKGPELHPFSVGLMIVGF